MRAGAGGGLGGGIPEPYVALLCRPVMNGALQTPICAWKASRAARRHDRQPTYGGTYPPAVAVVVVVVVVGGCRHPALAARRCGGSVTETG